MTQVESPVVSDAESRAGSSADSGEKIYRVGTLSYNTRGLAVLFAWMLWGDFCFTLMEAVVPSVLPLKLKSLGASNVTMALIMTTLPGILNSTICPWVSFRSDRYRSKWGRRIPFILWTAPFLTFFLILLSYCDPIGLWAHGLLAHSTTLPPSVFIVAVIGVFMVGFTFFNMFVGSVYWYLFNDVVPEECLGRFMGLFRTVGALAGGLYNIWIFPHAETHMREILIGAALLYLFGFSIVCFKVKEGNYPPPPENFGGRRGLWAGIRTFSIECYSLRYYWYFFVHNAMAAMAYGCITTFTVFFSRNIGLDLDKIGRVNGYATMASVVLFIPAGMLADRFHPMRMLTFAFLIVLILPVNLLFLLVDVTQSTAFQLSIFFSFLTLPVGLVYSAALLPVYMRLLPKERYGQFCAADSLVRSAGLISGGLLVGWLMDVLAVAYKGDDYYYRYIPVWTWGCQLIGGVSLIMLYHGWKKHGGATHYVPPMAAQPSPCGDAH